MNQSGFVEQRHKQEAPLILHVDRTEEEEREWRAGEGPAGAVKSVEEHKIHLENLEEDQKREEEMVEGEQQALQLDSTAAAVGGAYDGSPSNPIQTSTTTDTQEKTEVSSTSPTTHTTEEKVW